MLILCRNSGGLLKFYSGTFVPFPLGMPQEPQWTTWTHELNHWPKYMLHYIGGSGPGMGIDCGVPSTTNLNPSRHYPSITTFPQYVPPLFYISPAALLLHAYFFFCQDLWATSCCHTLAIAMLSQVLYGIFVTASTCAVHAGPPCPLLRIMPLIY